MEYFYCGQILNVMNIKSELIGLPYSQPNGWTLVKEIASLRWNEKTKGFFILLNDFEGSLTNVWKFTLLVGALGIATASFLKIKIQEIW